MNVIFKPLLFFLIGACTLSYQSAYGAKSSANYKIMPKGEQCRSQDKVIGNIGRCEEAAKELGKFFFVTTTVKTTHLPAGCFYNAPEEEIAFNEVTNILNTRTQSWTAGVCKIKNQEKLGHLKIRKSDCTPKKSVGQCERCLTGDQCSEGFCCPLMKLCVATSTTRCGGGKIANCSPRCYDNMDPKSCNCKNSAFPDKWAKPTCPEVEREIDLINLVFKSVQDVDNKKQLSQDVSKAGLKCMHGMDGHNVIEIECDDIGGADFCYKMIYKDDIQKWTARTCATPPLMANLKKHGLTGPGCITEKGHGREGTICLCEGDLCNAK